MLLLLLMLLNLWTAKVICEDNSINKESYQNSKKVSLKLLLSYKCSIRCFRLTVC